MNKKTLTAAAFETLRVTVDEEAIATILIACPGKSVNTLSTRVLAELSLALDAVERERAQGLIIASGKTGSFIVGADLMEIEKMDRPRLLGYLADGQSLFARIAALPIPTVAAINGNCLGGGLELALACSARVASNDASATIGLPEVKLGIIPGWGGTVRLPRLIGLTRGLPLMLGGKTLPLRKALKAGIVDEVVRPEAVLSAARRLALAPPRPRRLKTFDRVLASSGWARQRVFAKARARTLETTRGNYPAPQKLIDVVERGYAGGGAAGFDAEREALASLVQTDACQNLVRLFFLRQGAKRWINDELHVKGAEVKRAAVIGGGTMGAGIVQALIMGGIDVRLIETDVNAMSAALVRVRKLLDDDVAAGRLDRLGARNAMNRLSPATDWSGLRLADLAIEAVIENADAKREVFSRLDRLTRPDAVLATNTSSLSVTAMAAAANHPGRVVGLHFFNPVARMPLVEVIRADASTDAALATAAGLAAKLGKTAILVKDAPGFLVNRVLIPYLAEALAMGAEGIPIAEVDAAMKNWGMPMGPFELLDTIGLDVAVHVLTSLGGVLHDPPLMPSAMGIALQRRWLGEKSGRGFYEHGEGERKKGLVVHQALQQLLAGDAAGEAAGAADADARSDRAQAIAWRLVLPMVNEAARVLTEGVTTSADAIDLATVLGLGLAPFRGGLVHFADAVGTAALVAKLERLAAESGPRFAPAPLLRELAAVNTPLSAWQSVMPVEPGSEASERAGRADHGAAINSLRLNVTT